MTILPEGISPAEVGVRFQDARAAMGVIDEIIQDIYLPFRGAEGYGTERAVLVAKPHVHHRENDAEHSWHLAFTSRVIWDLREELGIIFPDDFDMGLATQYAIDHDVVEIWAGDVNALTMDANLIELKQEREAAALDRLTSLYPNLGGLALRLNAYEKRESAEAQYVSDLDKIIATRTIFLDGGKKWHDWEGQYSTKAHMFRVVRGKLCTNLGHGLLDVIEEDINKYPEVFPSHETSAETHMQLRFF